MGYFNYFIKCIIRNIAYRLCKPKVLLTFLLSIAILFVLHSTGYCSEWSESDITTVKTELSNIHNLLDNQINWLSSIEDDTVNIRNQLISIKTELDSIDSNTENAVAKLDTLSTQLNSLSVTVNNLILQAEENNEELKTTIIDENNKTLEKLTQIYDLLYGTVTETGGSYSSISGEIYPNGNIGSSSWVKTGYMQYNSRYKYKIVFTANYAASTAFTINISGSSVSPYVGLQTEMIQSYGLAGGRTYTFTVPSGLDYKFINFTYFASMGISVSIIEETGGALTGIQDGLDQGNQLQQENNQLQQEQNDFLKDDNVDTDGFEFATNDTNNPTEEGFNTLFTSIYNAFCNTSSEPLTVTLPYVNESFTIQPNLVSNAMQKCGLGVVATLIQSFYYYGVCLFIYKDINKIIEHLKSGNLTADCGNVKTEVL